MKFTMQKQAAVLLLLVCGQYVFAASAAAVHPSPKPAGKAGAKPAAKPAAKPVAKPVAKPSPKPAGKTTSCPAGYHLQTVNGRTSCVQLQQKPANGRQLQSLDLLKQDVNINIKGTEQIPIPILPEPLGYINIEKADSKPTTFTKNMNTWAMFPQIVLPPSHTILNIPEPKKEGIVSVTGSIVPKDIVIPVLPEPKASIVLPETKAKGVSVNVDIKKVPKFIDLSGLNDGKQKYNITVKLPAEKNILPNVVVNDPKQMKVIDLTGGKKVDVVKVIDVPDLSIPKPNVNIQLPYSGKTTVKYVDLTGKGTGKTTNIVIKDNSDRSVKNVNVDLGGKATKATTEVISKHNPAIKDPPVKNVAVDLSGGKAAETPKTIVLNVGDKKPVSGPTLAQVVQKAQKLAAGAKVEKVDLGLGKSTKTAPTINIQVPALDKKPITVSGSSTRPTPAKVSTETKTVTIGSGSGKTTVTNVDIKLPILDKKSKA